MAEWLKAAVLKTADRETGSWVRIPVPPPEFEIEDDMKPYFPTVVPSPTEQYIKHYHDKFQKSKSREDAEHLIKFTQKYLDEQKTVVPPENE
jgi:hypothetical protein